MQLGEKKRSFKLMFDDALERQTFAQGFGGNEQLGRSSQEHHHLLGLALDWPCRVRGLQAQLRAVAASQSTLQTNA